METFNIGQSTYANINTDDIDFECIKKFLLLNRDVDFKYIRPDRAGNRSKEMRDASKAGQAAVIEFQKYAGEIEKALNGYAAGRCSNWQNSGNLSKYLWIEFKKKGAENYPHSISVFIYFNGNHSIGDEILIGFYVESKDNKHNELDYKFHNRIVEVPLEKESGLHYRADTFSDGNKNYESKNDVIEDLNSKRIKKLLIGKTINGPYVKKNSSNIIKDSIETANSLIPFYEHIIDERHKAFNEEFDDNMGKEKDKNREKEFVMGNTNIGLNTILFGPPGTGKTYNTVNYAVSICDNVDLNVVKSRDYNEVLRRYNELKDEGRIIFTTFHQSYGYEEFIEGIYPVISRDNEENDLTNLNYEIKSGIFKSLCIAADKTIIKDNAFKISEDAKIWKVTVRSGVIKDCFDNDYIRIDWDINDGGAETFVNQINKGDIILTTNGSRRRINGIAVVCDDEAREIISEESDKTARNVKWIAKYIDEDITNINEHRIMHRRTVAKLPRIKIENLVDCVSKKNIKSDEIQVEDNNKPYVLIIDEINRGNISKIFGELITLIEDTKRKGMEEETSAVLPYSRDKFSVPSNIYIIGTMNTADRSIALMDTALRRRFRFVEMMPDIKVLRNIEADKLDGLDIAEMLKKINERITFLYDREHTIGHAFFVKLANKTDTDTLGFIFKTSIFPLLQEYFYEDYQKIQLVLGDNGKTDSSTKFILDEDLRIKDVIKGNVDYDIDLPEKKYTINDSAFYNIESYKQII